MSVKHLVVFVTTGSIEEAETIAKILISERLAACVNRIGPVTSLYEWQGEICEEEEYILKIKTQEARLQALTARVREMHSYDVSEIIAVPVVGGSSDYLNWVTVQTRENQS